MTDPSPAATGPETGESRPPADPARTGNPRALRHFTVLDGGVLRQLRGEQGLSRQELAVRAGISTATIAKLERQSRAPCRCYTLAYLAHALGGPFDALAAQPEATEK
jgi:DNA-binding XRE family transcriptional regulator